MVGVIDILLKPGVAGDRKEDVEDTECVSAKLEEFLRVLKEEVVEMDLSLREKIPIVLVCLFVCLFFCLFGLAWLGLGGSRNGRMGNR